MEVTQLTGLGNMPRSPIGGTNNDPGYTGMKGPDADKLEEDFLKEWSLRPRSTWTDSAWYDSNGIIHANMFDSKTGKPMAPDDRLDYIVSQYIGYAPELEQKTPSVDSGDKPHGTTFMPPSIDGTTTTTSAAAKTGLKDRSDVLSLAEMLERWGHGYGYETSDYDNIEDFYNDRIMAIAAAYNIDPSSADGMQKIMEISRQEAISSNKDMVLQMLQDWYKPKQMSPEDRDNWIKERKAYWADQRSQALSTEG